MPHLSPIMWLLVVLMFLVVLMVLISSMWWMQLAEFNIGSNKLVLKENIWRW
uniref:ATP synthase F0 subunit 8 n=1 Tax=Auchenoplax crinita TaxID=397536 RepID=G8XXL0_AUCCR|nr:ATP synthase F0 subunit 8 [Auchenoplax crinita]